MSQRHPIIAVTGSSGAGTTTVMKSFAHIFRRENIRAQVIEGDSFHRFNRVEMRERTRVADLEGNHNLSHSGPDSNLLAELEQIREQGHAVNRGEYGGDVGAVAAVITGASGMIVGAIALTVPIYRFDRRRCRELRDIIVEAAGLLSQRLGSAPA